MAEYNIIEDLVIPEMPRVIDNEQLFVYVPKTNYHNFGIAKFSKNNFIVKDGEVDLPYSLYDFNITLNSVSETLSKTTEQLANVLPLKADLIDGKIPSSQLPSYVDDVLEYDSFDKFPAIGEKGKIYVNTDDNTSYRWGGTSYVELTDLSHIETALTNKLDKVAHFNQGVHVYANGNNGNQLQFLATVSPENYAIPYRNDRGTFQVNDPVSDKDVVNLSYMNEKLNDKLSITSSQGETRTYGISPNGEQILIPAQVSASASYSTIMLRNSKGNSFVSIPTENGHTANKKYVDEQDINLVTNQEILKRTTDGNANAEISMRTFLGLPPADGSKRQHYGVMKLSVTGVEAFSETAYIQLSSNGTSNSIDIRGGVRIGYPGHDKYLLSFSNSSNSVIFFGYEELKYLLNLAKSALES